MAPLSVSLVLASNVTISVKASSGVVGTSARSDASVDATDSSEAPAFPDDPRAVSDERRRGSVMGTEGIEVHDRNVSAVNAVGQADRMKVLTDAESTSALHT